MKIPRSTLAKFLPDERTIREFERLFDVVTPIEDGAASSAEDRANDAVALAQAVQAMIQSDGESIDQGRDAEIQSIKSDIDACKMAVQSVASDVQVAIDALQITPPAEPGKRTRFGMFLDTTTQTAAAINTATAITFNTTSYTNGVYVGSPTSRIVVDESAIYNFQFSIQLDKSTGGTANFWIWLAVNGADVPNSASQIQIQGNNAEIFSAANFLQQMKAGDYAEFKFSVSDTAVQLAAFATSAPVPAIPSIILTVTNNL